MAYCIQDDILNQLEESALIELTDDENTGAVVDAVVARAIADADATIDAYCQGRYSVPLSPVPEKIRQVSVDIAIYNLYSRRGDVVPEVRKDRYREAVRFLEKVADGKITLGTTTPSPTNTENTVNIDGSDRIFTRDKMAGF